ncbi:hypothetical protein EDD21DRAFT_380449 [Dissophora ornata]|nr:hypothetical protein EDD21DRAFT_380449 [Dissophora ornata]
MGLLLLKLEGILLYIGLFSNTQLCPCAIRAGSLEMLLLESVLGLFEFCSTLHTPLRAACALSMSSIVCAVASKFSFWISVAMLPEPFESLFF